MAEQEKNTAADERIDDQPIGSDFNQGLVDFLEAEFAKRSPIKEFLGRFVPLFGIIKGLDMTRRAMFAPKSTIQYPEEKLPVAEGFRGRHVLLTEPSGEQICIADGACALVCPVNCIEVKWEPAKETSRRKRDLLEYNVDLTKCLFCGLCVDVCPEFCLLLGPEYEYSETTRGPGMLHATRETIERKATNEEMTFIRSCKDTRKSSGGAGKKPAEE